MPALHSQNTSPFRRPPPPEAVKVLILDDERFDRHRLARHCSALPRRNQVYNAKSLQELAAQLETQQFDLILLDYALPDGTGLDGLHLVRLCPRNLNTPTLMISGRSDPGIAAEARTMGCFAYLQKDDLTAEYFSQTVDNALASVETAIASSKQSYCQEDVEILLAHCTQNVARNVKPMVSRMLRQIRQLRAQPEPDLTALEQNCLSLWAYLIETERETGADLLQNLTEPQAEQPPPTRTASLFSKTRH